MFKCKLQTSKSVSAKLHIFRKNPLKYVNTCGSGIGKIWITKPELDWVYYNTHISRLSIISSKHNTILAVEGGYENMNYGARWKAIEWWNDGSRLNGTLQRQDKTIHPFSPLFCSFFFSALFFVSYPICWELVCLIWQYVLNYFLFLFKIKILKFSAQSWVSD